MATWDEIRKSINHLAQKVNRKAEELTDVAAMKIRLNARKAELEDEYLLLGKLAYESLGEVQSGEEAETETAAETDTEKQPEGSTIEKINASAAHISQLLQEIAMLEDKIAHTK